MSSRHRLMRVETRFQHPPNLIALLGTRCNAGVGPQADHKPARAVRLQCEFFSPSSGCYASPVVAISALRSLVGRTSDVSSHNPRLPSACVAGLQWLVAGCSRQKGFHAPRCQLFTPHVVSDSSTCRAEETNLTQSPSRVGINNDRGPLAAHRKRWTHGGPCQETQLPAD